jgi:hypothetical protein
MRLPAQSVSNFVKKSWKDRVSFSDCTRNECVCTCVCVCVCVCVCEREREYYDQSKVLCFMFVKFLEFLHFIHSLYGRGTGF